MKQRNYFLIVLLSATFLLKSLAPVNKLGVTKVVIWGHKLHSHTHSYIHQAFYKAFRYMGYETYWLDNSDRVDHLDLSNALFISEWQVDQNIPIRNDGFYFIHNLKIPLLDRVSPRIEKYQHLIDSGRCTNFRPHLHIIPDDAIEVEPFVHHCYTRETLFIPWATDLLPHEIDEVKKDIAKKSNKERVVHFVGTFYPDTQPFRKSCVDHGVRFQIHHNKSIEENRLLVQKSYMAPALVNNNQQEIDYIPCRIFKNISYGQLGVTNSRVTNELFQDKLVYNQDQYQLFIDAQKKIDSLDFYELYDQMNFVRDNHTYINRIEQIFDFIYANYRHKQKGRS